MFATATATSTPFSPRWALISDDERRDCPRVPMERITAWFSGVAHEGWGDVSTGGALWTGAAEACEGERLDLEFELDGRLLRVRAEVLSVEGEAEQTALHLRFVELPFEAERSIARHVDDCVLLSGV